MFNKFIDFFILEDSFLLFLSCYFPFNSTNPLFTLYFCILLIFFQFDNVSFNLIHSFIPDFFSSSINFFSSLLNTVTSYISYILKNFVLSPCWNFNVMKYYMLVFSYLSCWANDFISESFLLILSFILFEIV